jgi:hypothetical protein
MLTTCMSTRKKAWQRMLLLRSAWAKSLSVRGIPAVSTGQWSPLSRGSARLVWHCTCYCSNQGFVWDPARVPAQISASPEKARFGKIAHVV